MGLWSRKETESEWELDNGTKKRITRSVVRKRRRSRRKKWIKRGVAAAALAYFGFHAFNEHKKTNKAHVFPNQPHVYREYPLNNLFSNMDRKNITFLVNGHNIGMFEYKRERVFNRITFTFKSEEEDPGDCIKISIQSGEVELKDYFYFAQFDTTMKCKKPKTETEHRRILNTLLEFLAYVFHQPRIVLYDVASRNYSNCPKLETPIFLVAGKPSFYEKIAGFKNKKATDAAAITAKMPIAHDFGNTMGAVAATLVRRCQEGNHNMNNADTYNVINRIYNEFHEQYQKISGGSLMYYTKELSRTYDAVITQSDEMQHNELVNPVVYKVGDPIKEYIFIDIQA